MPISHSSLARSNTLQQGVKSDRSSKLVLSTAQKPHEKHRSPWLPFGADNLDSEGGSSHTSSLTHDGTMVQQTSEVQVGPPVQLGKRKNRECCYSMRGRVRCQRATALQGVL
jgi:hypothetical protein